MQYEIADRIHAEHVNQVIGIDHVAAGLAHLVALVIALLGLVLAAQKPRMTEYLLRQRLSQRHQEDGPVDGMEPDDILADQVQIRRPVLLVEVAVIAVHIISQSGCVVAEGVKPHIDHVLRVEIHRDSPLEGGSGDAEVLQARQKEVVHHLVLAGHRLDEFRMGIDVLNQPVRILAHTEEVSLFLGRLHRSSAVRALAVHQLGLGPEGLAGSAVHALIAVLVDIALLIELLENLLHLDLVIRVRGTDKAVIGGVHQVPDPLNLRCHAVHEFLRGNAGLLGLQLDLLSVLVGTGLEPHVKSLLSLVAGDGVGQHDLIGVADVRLARGISDRRRNIIRFFNLFHDEFLQITALYMRMKHTLKVYPQHCFLSRTARLAVPSSIHYNEGTPL